MENAEKGKYIKLEDLEIYKLSREASKIGWEIYQGLDWQDKKIMGDQFITALDSVGANIAEGYGRYHYLDRIKFCYNARASLIEAISHWLDLLKERGKIKREQYLALKEKSETLSLKLNNFIASIYRSKDKENKQ